MTESASTTTLQYALSVENFKPLFDSVANSVTTLLPYGIGICGLFLGISIMKRVLFTFM